VKVGDLVYSIYPRIHGEGHGIVMKYKKGSTCGGWWFPSKAEVYWPVTGKKDWLNITSLYMEDV